MANQFFSSSKTLSICLVLILCAGNQFSLAQSLDGAELLRKSIDFHDPNNNWERKKFAFTLRKTRPNSPNRKSYVFINGRKDYFELRQKRDNHVIKYSIQHGNVDIHFDGSDQYSERLRDSFRLTPERGLLLKNYYSYLWGQPMKLKDPGTQVHEKIRETNFNGVPVYVLKVSYDPDIGEDLWYFYFEKKDYRLCGYRFFHDENKNDGEFITLSEMVTINGIRIPKVRKWYTNQDQKYLGSDIVIIE